MEIILEVLKYTIPALIVFATAYFMMKAHLEDHAQTLRASLRNEQVRITTPIKMQAYERLAIMVDRIGVAGLIKRLRTPGMTVGDLQLVLMMGVQQEYEYNAAQQIYVSGDVWKITQFVRDGTIALIDRAGEGLDQSAPADAVVANLLALLPQQEAMTAKALQALRSEAASVFGA